MFHSAVSVHENAKHFSEVIELVSTGLSVKTTTTTTTTMGFIYVAIKESYSIAKAL